MVLFVGAHRPDRKPVFRLFRVSGRSAGRVCRTTGDSESRFAAFPGSGSDSGFCSGFCRGCGGGAALQDLFGPRCTWPAFGRCPRSGCGVLRMLHFGLRPLTFYFGCRPGTVCRFRREVSPASLLPGAVNGCRRCPRSGGAACASGACRRSSAPPLQARSPGRARAWRSTTARRRSP